MACLEMYNSEHHQRKGIGGGASPPSSAPPMSPRISFSNDFVESSHQQVGGIMKSRELGPPSSDFEFSVSNYSMMSADELFSKGRLLPLRDNCCTSTNNYYYSGSSSSSSFNFSQSKPTTLRDELLLDLDDDGGGDGNDEFALKPPKGRWKGFLGLRKSHIGSRRVEKTDGSSSVDATTGRFVDAAGKRATPQEASSEVGSSNHDMEMEI